MLAQIMAGLAAGSELGTLLARCLDPIVRLAGAQAGAVRVLSDARRLVAVARQCRPVCGRVRQRAGRGPSLRPLRCGGRRPAHGLGLGSASLLAARGWRVLRPGLPATAGRAGAASRAGAGCVQPVLCRGQRTLGRNARRAQIDRGVVRPGAAQRPPGAGPPARNAESRTPDDGRRGARFGRAITRLREDAPAVARGCHQLAGRDPRPAVLRGRARGRDAGAREPAQRAGAPARADGSRGPGARARRDRADLPAQLRRRTGLRERDAGPEIHPRTGDTGLPHRAGGLDQCRAPFARPARQAASRAAARRPTAGRGRG